MKIVITPPKKKQPKKPNPKQNNKANKALVFQKLDSFLAKAETKTVLAKTSLMQSSDFLSPPKITLLVHIHLLG